MIGNTLFCEGVGCTLKGHCHHYVDGSRIDPHAEGYAWMPSCDVDERNGYLPVWENKQM